MHYDDLGRRVPMPSLQIRELPDDVYEALADRARRQGRSLAQQAVAELRKMTELAAADRRRHTLDLLAQPGKAEHRALPDPVDLIREDRDA
jgi:plasmid stability protein